LSVQQDSTWNEQGYVTPGYAYDNGAVAAPGYYGDRDGMPAPAARGDDADYD
jgi:hypothetical protein